jgi:hypothetical protein
MVGQHSPQHRNVMMWVEVSSSSLHVGHLRLRLPFLPKSPSELEERPTDLKVPIAIDSFTRFTQIIDTTS